MPSQTTHAERLPNHPTLGVRRNGFPLSSRWSPGPPRKHCSPQKVEAVILDWAGTTVDPGSRAPVVALTELFARYGIVLSEADARGPMGVHKRDHIAELLRLPHIAEAWKSSTATRADDDAAEFLFREFLPLQLEILRRRTDLVPGFTEALALLRREGLRIGATTGYTREMLELVKQGAARKGYVPDCAISVSDVPIGRPAPWMVHRAMALLGVEDPASVIKIGDTVADIQEGRAAGTWSVGIVTFGNTIGLSPEDLAALPTLERKRRVLAGRRSLWEAGAHAIMDDWTELSAVLVDIDNRLKRGERP